MSIFLVTHGKKFPGENPGMTEDGFDEVSALRDLLPAVVNYVVCGTGKRHLDVAKALGLAPTRYTSAVGGPDSGEATVKGQPVDVVRLPDGTLVPYSQYTTLADTAAAMQALLCSLPDDTVVCAGRPSMIMLGVDEVDSKSAAVYKVTTSGNQITSIEEVITLGEAEINPA